jgi:tetratricopeptide (TPR) repeat protein
MRRVRLRLLGISFALVACCHGQSTLAPGVETHVTLTGAAMASFDVAIWSGQFARLVAVAPDSAVSLIVFNGAGQHVAQANSLGGTGGDAETALLAEAAQTYRVEVRLSRKDAVARKVTVTLAILRAAADDDRADAAAQSAYSRALDVRAKIDKRESAPALAALEDSLQLARAAADLRLEVSIAMTKCEVLAGAGDYQHLIEAAEAAIPVARMLPDRRAEAQFLYADALAHLQSEDSKGSIPLFEQSLSAAREAHQQYEMSQSLHNMSSARYVLGDCSQALEEAQGALALRRELGDRARQGYSLRAIAGDYLCLGDAQHALDTYSEALTVFRDLKDQANEAAVLNGRGVIESYSGDWQNAEISHRDSLLLRTKLKDTLGAAESLVNLGALRLALGRYSQAGEDCTKGLSLARQNHHRRSEAYALQCLGESQLGRSEAPAALASLEEAVQLSREIEDRGGEAWAWLLLGKLHQSQKDAPAAQLDYEKALDLETAVGDRIGETITRAALARVFRDEGDRERGLTSAEKAIALIESSRSSLMAGNLRAAYMASKRDVYELEISLLTADRASEAFRASELSHARVLLDGLAESKIDLRAGLDPKLRAEQELLETRSSAQADVLARLNGAPEAQMAEERAKLDRLYAEQRDLETRIKETNPRYATLVLPSPSTVPQVQHALLDDDTRLVEYFVGDTRSYGWVLTIGSIQEFELPGRAQLERMVRRYYHAQTERNRLVTNETVSMRAERYRRADEAARDGARSLSKLLLGPVGAGRRLIVVPDGPLNLVPFVLLQGSGRQVITLPSASLLVEMRKDPNVAAHPPMDATLPALIIADPVFGGDDPRVSAKTRRQRSVLARLEWSRQEARNIASLVPASEVSERLDFAANVDALRGADVARFAVIHIATHAVVDMDHPELTGIALSGVDRAGRRREGFLRLHDIYGLTLHPKLVVLSSCRTAMGPEVRGEGILGLSRGFLYAGAQAVVATLWSVDDQATAVFMVRFYRELWDAHQPPVAALAAAQQWMMRQERWSSPYFWAAFTLTGNWR